MPTNVETDIEDALAEHLATQIDPWLIAYENIDFKPPNDGRYYRVQHFPNDTQAPFLGNDEFRYLGLYQITVVTPTGEGAIKNIDERHCIKNLFAAGTLITTPSGIIKIYNPPTFSSGRTLEHSFEASLTVRYEIFSN